MKTKFARSPLLDQETRINPAFPRRPTSHQIDEEYTPARVIRLAKYIAGGKKGIRAEQMEEDVSIATLAIYSRIDEYKRGATELPEKFSFYHWLLFRTRADLSAQRHKLARSLGGRQLTRITEEYIDSRFNQEIEDERLDLREALETGLEQEDRELLIMYYEKNMTQEKIAAKLGVSQAAVNQRLAAARDKLAVRLGREETE